MADRDERTGAELLREAAALMRERANIASPGRWSRIVSDRYPDAEETPSPAVVSDSGYTVIDEFMPVRDAEHIASWHPAVALAVADLLDWCADQQERTRHIAIIGPARAVARAYLSAPVSAGEPAQEARDEQ